MNAIEKLIIHLNETKVGFAERLGVSRIMVFHYISDRCMPSLKVANKILRIAKNQGISMELADILRTPKKRKKSGAIS
jgi:DNA-binding XRE family transcriptional regulator